MFRFRAETFGVVGAEDDLGDSFALLLFISNQTVSPPSSKPDGGAEVVFIDDNPKLLLLELFISIVSKSKFSRSNSNQMPFVN